MKLSDALIAWTPAWQSDSAVGKVEVGPQIPDDWAKSYAARVMSSGDDERALLELMLTFAGLIFDGVPVQRLHRELLTIDEYASVWGEVEPPLYLVN